jgi:hypothetical protein
MASQQWWVAKGFAKEPRSVVAKGGELLYRVGGGPTSSAMGSFFSPLKVDCVSRAELSLNIALWGNRCYFVATYRVKPGTWMWIGKVAHGNQDIANRDAEQVFIEHPCFAVELVRDVEPLKQDFFVSPRTGHA